MCNDKSCLGSRLFFYLILENIFIQDKFCLTVIISFPLIVESLLQQLLEEWLSATADITILLLIAESLLQLSLNRRMIKKSFFTTPLLQQLLDEWWVRQPISRYYEFLCFYLKTCINKQWIYQHSLVTNVKRSVNLNLV